MTGIFESLMYFDDTKLEKAVWSIIFSAKDFFGRQIYVERMS